MSSSPVNSIHQPIFSALEREVIRLGIRDGKHLQRGSIRKGLLALANPSLEALRAWTELLSSGHGAPVAMLAEAGYSPAQITEAQRLITAAARADEGEAA